MAVELIFKNSAVKDQKPSSGAALAKGELALNSHALSPALYLKDTDGNIQQVAGVVIGTDAPGSPVRGAWWLDIIDNTLRLYDGTNWIKVAGGGGSGGGGGGTTTIVAGDGINATKVGDEYTLSWDADITKGLAVVSGKAAIQLKTGGGLKFDGGELAIDPSQSAGVDLGYLPDGDDAGTVTNSDGTDATIPVVEDSIAGLMTGAQKQKLDDIEADAQVNVLETVAGSNGIAVSTSGTTATVGAKLGAGLQLDASGNIQATNPPLIYQGIADLTSATVPAANPGDFYSSSTAGNISAAWGAVLANASAGDATSVGDLATYNGTDWNLIPTGGVPGATNLSNTPSINSVEIQSSTGSNTTIAAATNTTAGVMSANDKAALDGDFVLLEDGGTQQDITGGGGLSTDGLFEGKGGVEVSGGDGIVNNGLYFNSGDVLVASDSGGATLKSAASSTDDTSVISATGPSHAGIVLDGKSNNTKLTRHFGVLCRPQFKGAASESAFGHMSQVNAVGLDTPILYGYAATTTSNTEYTNIENTVGFLAGSSFGRGSVTNIGFKSELYSSQTGAFNFYAENAPNFFAGTTYIGGNTARNTLEAWLSTLTEEQTEKYRDGTFVAPADVANPGDGKWMRQWWYDQQSAEDQALIDSGELAYPTNLLPENFTDSFALGDNTKVDINATGGITIKSGNTPANVETGVFGNAINHLAFATDGANRGYFSNDGALQIVMASKPATSRGVNVIGTLDDVAEEVRSFISNVSPPVDAGKTKTLEAFTHYSAGTQATFDGKFADSESTHYGFHCLPQINHAETNVAFKADLNDTTKDSWNFYAGGTARNFFNGFTGIGVADPQRELDVNGDILCSDKNKGLILVSPNNTQYRLTVANDGTLSTSAV